MPVRFALLMGVLLCACSADDPGERPYLEFAGGGFIFNYRLAEADYGFVARVLRPLPDGAVVEAEFDDPGGGPSISMSQPALKGRLQHLFRTPALRGVEAGRDYRVELRVREAADGAVLATYETTFRSDVDQSVLPDRPPVAGPGYHRPPESAPPPASTGTR